MVGLIWFKSRNIAEKWDNRTDGWIEQWRVLMIDMGSRLIITEIFASFSASALKCHFIERPYCHWHFCPLTNLAFVLILVPLTIQSYLLLFTLSHTNCRFRAVVNDVGSKPEIVLHLKAVFSGIGLFPFHRWNKYPPTYHL